VYAVGRRKGDNNVEKKGHDWLSALLGFTVAETAVMVSLPRPSRAEQQALQCRRGFS